ncbi:Rrf2 family transcriptional regulator [Sulfurimonas sp. MAG313]|nr:Rrf2 family transcriptional regulator [Sulfurimonas sp. MAG313]MDF1880999.1 Rrf2 family transcriptional regulator [Sulfurimonas sp. MAG313]
MLMTRASEYALLSLVTLAKASTPIDTETLAHDLAISKSFLAKILQSLAREGILKSYKGVKGGFVLIQAKEKITLLQIMRAAEGKDPSVFDCSVGVGNCPAEKEDSCHIYPFIHNLQERIDDFLEDMTLADILEKETV